MDLEIAKLQLKIQECLDKTASNERLEHELVSVTQICAIYSYTSRTLSQILQFN